ncbi:MAG: MBL fold metallo-hydrolase [Anaerolineae bacterium]|jgi:glyoxylase-like metal-dependent hydrolase (beta-lactamase superfamily II)
MSVTTYMEYLHAIELPTPFPVGPVTVYLADAPGEPITLLDTGPRTAEGRSALASALALLGHRVADLERIVISHAHADHFGLAAELEAASGAEVWSHPWNVTALADYESDRAQRTAFYADLLRRAAVPVEVMTMVGGATRGVNRYAAPVAVARTVKEGDRLPLAGDTWQVLHTPGHAAGLICLYEPERGVLLSSDHLLADISSNPVVEPPPPGHRQRLRSLALYRASLQRVAELEISLALPSHGPPIRDVAGLVQQRLRFHDRRVEHVAAALRNGGGTTWQVTLALFPNRSPLDTFLAVSEVIGHLDVMEMEGRVVREEAGGVDRWRLSDPAR